MEEHYTALDEGRQEDVHCTAATTTACSEHRGLRHLPTLSTKELNELSLMFANFAFIAKMKFARTLRC